MKPDFFKMASELHAQGQSYEDIAARLTAEGFKSPRGAKLDQTNLGSLMRAHGFKKRAKYKVSRSYSKPSVSKDPRPAVKVSKDGAIREILRLTSLPADERITLALLVLG